MAEQPKQPDQTPPPGPTWRSAWQVPALVGSVLLLAGGAITHYLTAPKPDLSRMLDQAAALVDAEKYDEALEGLNTRLLPYESRGFLSPEQTALFHTLRARSIYLGQQRLGVESAENARTVLDEFSAAKKLSSALTPRDLYFMADCWVSLQEYGRALELANQLPEAERAGRARILKRVVEQQLRDPKQTGEMALKLLADFLEDQSLPASDRAWALARQCELLIRRGMPESATTRLVQTLPTLLDEAGPESLGELRLLLGRAYLETGSIADAGREFQKASDLLLQSDERWAMATVMAGRVEEMTRGDEGRSEARARYESVAERFSGSGARLPALLALAELEATSNEPTSTDAGAAAYTELVKELRAGRHHPDATADVVTRSLVARATSRAMQSDHEAAIRFGEIAESLHTKDSAPAELLLALAMSHRAVAEAALRSGEGDALLELLRLDPASREQARLHLLSAGAYFRRHADRIGVADNEAFGRSLWLSADCYDLAGEPEQAIAFFGDYIKYFPDDPRRPEARFRLGQAYQARGDYALAADQYRTLITEAGDPGANIGPFADLSAVPLAQCLLLDADAGNDDAAEVLLWQVVQGKLGGVGSPQYRHALVELAALQSRRGEYAGAIQNLEEAVERFPQDKAIGSLCYSLADAYRQDARAISKTLTEALPDSRKAALTEARIARLQKAQSLFDKSRATLEAVDARRTSELERLQLRNAWFFAADCSFELRDFDQAIRRYDAARERYPEDPASLVAMIQIVNAYVEMGDLSRAATANERAKLFHKSLPPAAWNDPDLPISNTQWQRWLASMEKLKPLGPGGPDPSASPPSATVPESGDH